MKIIATLLFFLISLTVISQTIEPFLENIVTQFPNVRDVAMTSDETEVMISAQSALGDVSVLISVKKINNNWHDAEVASFSGRYFDLEPFFSKDNLTLYFVSNRPLDQSSNTTKDFDIWYVERADIDAEWSNPINIGAPINTSMDEFYPVITDSKNLYFTLDNPQLNQKDDIYISEFVNGGYTEPKRLGNAINSEGYEFNAFVSHDESYMIYTCYNKEGGFGSGDLYISKKTETNEWTPAKNVGNNINSDKMDYCPLVMESSKTLYFTSRRSSITPTFNSQVSLKELLNTFNSYENGLSRLYLVSIDSFLKMTD